MRKKLRPLDQGGWSIPKKSLLGVPWLVAHALQADGWTVRQEVIWCRKTAFPEPSVKDRPHRQHETVFLLSKSRWYYFNREALPEESVWHIAHQRGMKGHSAAYPVELAERCIAAGSKPGDVILDPFLGSGTTAVAARRLSRACIGIDLKGDYVNDAAARVDTQTPILLPREAASTFREQGTDQLRLCGTPSGASGVRPSRSEPRCGFRQ